MNYSSDSLVESLVVELGARVAHEMATEAILWIGGFLDMRADGSVFEFSSSAVWQREDIHPGR